jgi:hypothetical protein
MIDNHLNHIPRAADAPNSASAIVQALMSC